jgi:Cytochrome c7 and related cytochrome c/Class III cytochrome C family
MAALFPPWTNTASRLVLVLLVVLVVGIPTALCIYVRTPYVTDQEFPVAQPVEFDHRHHVADDGIDCRYCHATVESSPWAGVPPTATCMGCHDQIWNASAMLEPVRRAYFSGQPIVWRRVHELPDFVYFDHSIHVTRGIGCATCHGRVDKMGKVYQVAPLTMGWCLGCHRDPEPNLRPQAEITSMTWAPTGDPAVLAELLAHDYGTRRLTNCSTCHR